MRVNYIQCDRCHNEFKENDTQFGHFRGALWVEGSTDFDLCPRCSEMVQRYISLGTEWDLDDDDDDDDELVGEVKVVIFDDAATDGASEESELPDEDASEQERLVEDVDTDKQSEQMTERVDADKQLEQLQEGNPADDSKTSTEDANIEVQSGQAEDVAQEDAVTDNKSEQVSEDVTSVPDAADEQSEQQEQANVSSNDASVESSAGKQEQLSEIAAMASRDGHLQLEDFDNLPSHNVLLPDGSTRRKTPYDEAMESQMRCNQAFSNDARE